MFDKILIANRGEIACRVIRTARRMGIATVAVYSDADAEALHVRMADEAVRVGPAPSAKSYLDMDAIVEACRRTGAQAVHPGYGFLSENRAFAAALAEAGVTFIGPPPDAIAAMGDKIESKRLAKKAGVSTVPGYDGEIANAEEAAKVSREIGYPVMFKASAGGGGKGMRIVHGEAEVAQSLRSVRSEAKASFGDDRVLVEKYIEEPRHIEIQVLGDSYGNVLHLGERECSIQRRHQKVIEEAPSPFLDEETRAAMGAQAVALARAVGYASAGTVEFIVDRERNFYFLEMNTRLQVEHPVTEMVTGLDLVELMIRVAAGERLPFAQEDVRLKGWAIEARVYAEDPVRGFLPSIGRLVRYREPKGEGIRVDSGVMEGGEITVHYDPMIAKLVAYGPDRATATRRMGRALDGFHIRGVNHNIAFLNSLMLHPRFREGRLTTNFIAEEYPDGFSGVDVSDEARLRLVAVAAAVQHIAARQEASISGRIPVANGADDAEWVVRETADGALHPAHVAPTAEGLTVRFEGRTHGLACRWRPGEPLFEGTLDGEPLTVQVDRVGAGWVLHHAGAAFAVSVLRPRAAALAALMPIKAPPDMSRFLLSPMPGLLLSLAVAEGQEVKAGQELAVVEAMKMENVLKAERDGVVAKLRAKPGDSLSADQPILEFAEA